jgi:hypothetical protein
MYAMQSWNLSNHFAMPSSPSKDPAFLFYPGDASEDTQFMNRLERGCYFDILKAQKKFRRFSIHLIKKVLGNDFQSCWPALESVLRKEGELYFVGWADDAIENRAAHAEKQKKRIKDYWDRKKAESVPEPIQPDTTEQPKHNHGNSLENGNVIANEIVIKKEKECDGEKDFTEPDIKGDEIFFPVDTTAMRRLWAAWKEARWKNHKLSYAMYGEQAALKELEGLNFHQVRSAIQKAIAGNWRNLYPERNGQGKSTHDSKSRIDEIIANRFGSG